MNEETKSVTKKAVKIIAATCVAAGAVALVASGAALKAVTEGGRYLKDVVKKIMDEEPEQKEAEAEVSPEEIVADPTVEAEGRQNEAPADEEPV